MPQEAAVQHDTGRWAPLFVFALSLTVYLSSPVMVQTDSIWNIPTAASLWLRGDANLDEFPEALKRRQRYGVFEAGGHTYNMFPLGTSLVALPVIALMDTGLQAVFVALPRWTQGWGSARRWSLELRRTGDLDLRYFDTTERFIASLATSIAVLLVFLTLRQEVSLPAALIVAGATAFGTSAYSTASRVLWQHGPSLCATAGVAYLLARPRTTRAWAVLLGAVAAAAFALRPTNAVTVGVVTGWLMLTRPRQLMAFVLGATAVAIPFFATQVMLFGALLSPYFVPQRLNPRSSHLWEALFGNLVSPARGLFVFCPVFLFSLAELVRKLRRHELRSHEKAFALILVLHGWAIASFPHWWAGHSVGPRLFTDVVPYLVYFLGGPAERLVSTFSLHRLRSSLFVASLLVSAAIQTRAATSHRVHAWNDGPPNVDQDPSRLWSWRDPQFLR